MAGCLVPSAGFALHCVQPISAPLRFAKLGSTKVRFFSTTQKFPVIRHPFSRETRENHFLQAANVNTHCS